ncbi:MAG: NUDIX domain-containing protein [Fervidobacterium sp.]
MVYSEIIEKVRKSEKQRLAVMCYAQYGNKVLFLLRRKEPFAGFLVPPGGKVEKGEEIENAIRREFREETGLELNELKLKMVTTEEGPENYNWILFTFVGKVDSDKTIECNEGELTWIDKDKMLEENLSTIDRLLIPHIFKDDDKVSIIEIRYNEDRYPEIVSVKDV